MTRAAGAESGMQACRLVVEQNGTRSRTSGRRREARSPVCQTSGERRRRSPPPKRPCSAARGGQISFADLNIIFEENNQQKI